MKPIQVKALADWIFKETRTGFVFEFPERDTGGTGSAAYLELRVEASLHPWDDTFFLHIASSRIDVRLLYAACRFLRSGAIHESLSRYVCRISNR